MDELLKNHYQLICREDPWINRYLKNPPIRTKKEGTALHVRRQLLHVQWRHCFAIYTDLQRPNGRVSLRTVKSQLETVADEELNMQDLREELQRLDRENGSIKDRS